VSGIWGADCGAEGAAAASVERPACLRADRRAVVAQARPSKIGR
jgi:hypothetical protein